MSLNQDPGFTISEEADDGSPDAPSLRFEVPFTDFQQQVDFQWIVDAPLTDATKSGRRGSFAPLAGLQQRLYPALVTICRNARPSAM